MTAEKMSAAVPTPAADVITEPAKGSSILAGHGSDCKSPFEVMSLSECLHHDTAVENMRRALARIHGGRSTLLTGPIGKTFSQARRESLAKRRRA